MNNKLFCLAALTVLLAACSHSKGTAGAQGSQSGSDNSRHFSRYAIIYGDDYTPPRRYESSVLNEPDTGGANDSIGRGFRINGSGHGPAR